MSHTGSGARFHSLDLPKRDAKFLTNNLSLAENAKPDVVLPEQVSRPHHCWTWTATGRFDHHLAFLCHFTPA